MSNCYDINIDKGGRYSLPFQLNNISVDEDSGIETVTPIDISNSIIEVDFRSNAGTLLATYTTNNGGVVLSDSVEGQAILRITAAQTLDYTFTKARYGVKITYEDTSVEYLFEGKVYTNKTTTD
jgi:hypothetical protein